jgi:hypothetical protein
MSIRLSGAQITRIREAFHHFEDIAWQGHVARETLVEDILNIVLMKELECHINTQRTPKEQQNVSDW